MFFTLQDFKKTITTTVGDMNKIAKSSGKQDISGNDKRAKDKTFELTTYLCLCKAKRDAYGPEYI